MAKEVGLRFVLCDPRIYVNLPNETGWQQVVQQVIDDYSDHSSLYGYFLDDDFNDQLAKLMQEFHKRDPERIGYSIFRFRTSPNPLLK
ncbi:MAG: hypothetical protein QM487_06015 [Candidatus Marithrix sp.]